MKTLVSSDEFFEAPAPTGGVVSGRGCLIGKLFGIAMTTQAAGELTSFRRRGNFDHTAEGAGSGQAAIIGAVAYWDDTNKRITTTSSANTRVGVFAAVKATTDVSARIVLDGYVA